MCVCEDDSHYGGRCEAAPEMLIIWLAASNAFTRKAGGAINSQPATFAAAALRHGGASVALSAMEGAEDYAIEVPYKEAQYNPDAAEAFFRKRPLESLGRLAQLTRLSAAAFMRGRRDIILILFFFVLVY